MARKRLLITGAAGRIGQVLREGLKEDYDLRLMYHKTVLPAEGGDEVVLGSVAVLEAVEKATIGVDAVVHMAGNPRMDATFDEVMETNIRGTYNVYEACVRNGVPRVVFASTNHTTGYYEQEGIFTTPEMPARPDSLYGASKVFGEDLGRYFVDLHGLAVICLRIGSFQPVDAVKNRSRDRYLSSWLSYRDTVQLVRRSIEAEQVRFGIYYGISGNTRATWSIQNAREELGYEPEDDAEEFA